MYLSQWKMWLPSCMAMLFTAQAAHAQWAVIDAHAIAQAVKQVQTLEQQLLTARATLQQAQSTYDAFRGNRGMALLLGNLSRNYLPADWQQIAALVDGTVGTYGALSADVQSILSANAVLSAPQLAQLAPGDQQQIQATRQLGALRQTLSRRALADASARFAALQTLIGAISSASDPKAILDLQARIGAEVGMLQNEQAKLNALDQATQAQEAVYRQQQREQAIAADGNFASRLRPVP